MNKDEYFSLHKWMARERNEGRRGSERECYKRLSLSKHGVSLSSHMWNCLSGQSDALMEINQSDTTATFVIAQHSALFSFFPSFFCLSLPSLSPSSQGHHATVNRDIAIVLPHSCLPLSLSHPIYCCVFTDYQCNTSNKIHQPTAFPPSYTHFIYTGSENQRRRVIWDKKKMDVPLCEQHAQEPRCRQ